MTDKHTNSFEERNFKTQQDQADFRMQQMLKEKGFVRGASDKDLEKLNKNFNSMISRLKNQQEKLIINERYKAWGNLSRKLAH